uniref:Complex 1 LYR protein domain-containing protein n=1 Tax=Arcella intermedia TaxID=1963864 RepID=A0A6B2LRY3_9EUKA
MYRQCIDLGKRTWEGPQEEKDYILKETRYLFKKNRHLKNPNEIDLRIQEAESRIALGLHYKIPYPRMHNIIQVTPERVRRSPKNAFNNPVYMASYYNDHPEDSP